MILILKCGKYRVIHELSIFSFETTRKECLVYIFYHLWPAGRKLQSAFPWCICLRMRTCPSFVSKLQAPIMADAEETLYCLCQQPYDEMRFMIECEVCLDWFHGR